jgi:hypothetical protein
MFACSITWLGPQDLMMIFSQMLHPALGLTYLRAITKVTSGKLPLINASVLQVTVVLPSLIIEDSKEFVLVDDEWVYCIMVVCGIGSLITRVNL